MSGVVCVWRVRWRDGLLQVLPLTVTRRYAACNDALKQGPLGFLP